MKKQLLLGLFAVGLSGFAFSQTYTFSNAGATGQYGPTQVDVNAAYTGTSLDGAVTINTQGIQEWVVPQTGNYLITTIGACGGEGQGTYYPGLPGTGATITGEFALTAGTTIKIVVGQKGLYGDNGSGGGGGSFVFTGAPGGAGLLIAAGGGGGHGHGSGSVTTGAHGGGGSATQSQVDGAYGTGNGGSPGPGMGGNPGGGGCGYSGVGAGGAGWTTDGGTPAACGTATGGSYMTFEGGFGGADGLHGGFGGGGGSDGNGSPGGGGGGYTGGGGGNDFNGSAWGAGAGAGSYNTGSNPTNTAGVTGAASGYSHGSVTIEFLCSPTAGSLVPDNGSLPDVTADCVVTSLTPPTASNDCGSGLTGTPDVTLPVNTVGTTVVTWTYDDGTNTVTQTQNIVISGIDNDPPTIDDPNLLTYGAQCSFTPPTPTATDVCAGTINGVADVPFPITTQGTNVITWTYDDGSGNTVTQTQTININDVAAPAPDIATLPALDGCNSVTPPTATATDNCAGTINGIPDVSFPITTPGTTTVTWTYDDGNGNVTTQTQDVFIELLDLGVTVNGTTITADQAGAQYQWYNCTTGLNVVGNAQSFTATVTGEYAVIVTNGNCSDTSICTLIDFTGIDELEGDLISVYPNPTNTGVFNVDFDGKIDEILVYDALGRAIQLPTDLTTGTVDGSTLEAGSYRVSIRQNGLSHVKTIVIL